MPSESFIEAPERDRAVDWLKEILGGVDPMPSKEIFDLAKQEDFNDKTLQRARKKLGIKFYIKYNDDGERSWHWRLPDNDNKKKTSIPGLQKLLDNAPKLPKLPIKY